MEGLVAGDIIVVDIPFTSYEQRKRRPALVLVDQHDDDIICCSITTNLARKPWTLELTGHSFSEGTLHKESKARLDKLFTIRARSLRKIARLNTSAMREARKQVRRMFSI